MEIHWGLGVQTQTSMILVGIRNKIVIMNHAESLIHRIINMQSVNISILLLFNILTWQNTIIKSVRLNLRTTPRERI